MVLESKFQAELIKEIKSIFPGCMVLKNDPNYIQGIPDLTILHGGKWAVLEVKRHSDASRRPNQRYYVDKLNTMGYSAFIDPSNKEEVFDELQRALSSDR